MDLVRELNRMLDGTSIAELEVEYDQVKVHVQRTAIARPAAAFEPSVASPLAADRPVGHESGEVVVTAGYVGEFRKLNEGPGTGDEITAGTKLADIEVLGIRNAVVAPADGLLAAYLVEDGAPVEYGQPLAIIKDVSGGSA